MALDILTKGLSLDWTEDNQLYDHYKALRKRVELMMTGMALKKETQDFISHCIKAWFGMMGHARIEVVGLTVDNSNCTKCILDNLKGHCITKSTKILAATAYNQLEQGDLGLPEYIEKCKHVTAAYNFGAAYDKCL